MYSFLKRVFYGVFYNLFSYVNMYDYKIRKNVEIVFIIYKYYKGERKKKKKKKQINQSKYTKIDLICSIF